MINLQRRKLLHHFEMCTLYTLVLSTEMWHEVLQLSHSFDFLMDATLCIAARHLACLNPKDLTYVSMAANHLCRCLSGFRVELSNGLTSTHLDVFVATSLLLQFELWTHTDHISTIQDGKSTFDPVKDQQFTFASSLKQVFLSRFPASAIQASKFIKYLERSPTDVLVPVAGISKRSLDGFHRFFACDLPVTSEHMHIPVPFERDPNAGHDERWNSHAAKRDDQGNFQGNGYEPVVTKLCLVTSFLPEAHPHEFISPETMNEIMPSLSRLIMMFPITCHGPFISSIRASDPHALLILYHFYRTVRFVLSSEQHWWAHKRACYAEEALGSHLRRSMAKRISDYDQAQVCSV
jgi:hypothetical protein